MRSVRGGASGGRERAALLGLGLALVGCAAIQGLDEYELVDDVGPADGAVEARPFEASSGGSADGAVPPASLTCAAPRIACDGGCASFGDDPANCGGCGNACSTSNAVTSCVDGGCVLGSCAGTHADCNANAADGCEIDKAVDPLNCGGCGNVCPLGESCAGGVCSAVLTGGLLGYWPLDDAAGSAVAKDFAPNDLPAKIVGTVVFAPGQGKRGRGAGSFVGAGHLDVLFPNNAAGQGVGVFIPQGNVTYAMWIKTANAVVQGLSVITGSTFGEGCDRTVGNGAAGTLAYNAWSDENITGTIPVNDGAWHHVAYVMDQTNGLFAYVDGVLDGSDANPTTNCGVGCSGFNWATNYQIGTGGGCRFGAGDFTGLIDDVRLYGRPLSAAEVAALFDATK